MFLLFRNIFLLPISLAFLTLQDKLNTGTLKVKIKFILHKIYEQARKVDKKSLIFYLFLKLVQINYIFSDNVHVLNIYYVIEYVTISFICRKLILYTHSLGVYISFDSNRIV